MGIRLMICLLALSLIHTPQAHSHCEIPCGIYDDEARLKSIEEDIATIEKAIESIKELSSMKSPDYNQLVRWVGAKEDHAGRIQHTVSQYFLTQRVKPAGREDAEVYEKYLKELSTLHQMLVYAMKAKQSTDTTNTEALRSLLKEFEAVYR